MKTKLYIILTAALIQTGSLYATYYPTGIEISELTPVPPKEATFDEGPVIPTPTVDLRDLQPILPETADFSDTISPERILLESLTPDVPVEASFEE